MLSSLSSKHLPNVKVTIGYGEIICEDVESTTQVHQLWSWAMSLLQTTPRTTLVLIEGVFRGPGGMTRIDKAHGIYLSWRGHVETFSTEGWPDGSVRQFRFFKGVPCTLFISIRQPDQEPAHEQAELPAPEVIDLSAL